METANIQSVVENNIVSVALMNIQPSNYNPRKHFDEASLAELAESIRQQGVLQPIGVRPIVDTDRFEIIFGERRYRAALMAELTEIPAVILHVSDETAAEMAVTENLHRGSQRLPKAHGKRSLRCAVIGRAVRQKRELYPYPSEIRIIDTRNRRTSGKGRNHNQCSE